MGHPNKGKKTFKKGKKQFFSLFNRSDMGIERGVNGIERILMNLIK